MAEQQSTVYAVGVVNGKTGERIGWLWNQTAQSPEAAMAKTDATLRALGWPKGSHAYRAMPLEPARYPSQHK